ncbi:hypothetical protein BH09CHL1_BH09CHL1_19000 [soil metagenome]
MPFLLTRIKVTDFDHWRQTFDEDAGTRLANGSKAWRVFRNGSDSDDVWVLLEWDDLMRARLFANSDDMIDELIRAGISNHPDYWFLEEMNLPAL